MAPIRDSLSNEQFVLKGNFVLAPTLGVPRQYPKGHFHEENFANLDFRHSRFPCNGKTLSRYSRTKFKRQLRNGSSVCCAKRFSAGRGDGSSRGNDGIRRAQSEGLPREENLTELRQDGVSRMKLPLKALQNVKGARSSAMILKMLERFGVERRLSRCLKLHD